MTIRCSVIAGLMALSVPVQPRANPSRGTITIERIAHIKYPSAPAWSPDGRMAAFLWDAWGKQDLFVATPGQPPMGADRFSRRSRHPDVRHLVVRVGLERRAAVCERQRPLDGVAIVTNTGAGVRRSRRRREFHAVARSEADRVRAWRSDLGRLAGPEDRSARDRGGAADGVEPCLLA